MAELSARPVLQRFRILALHGYKDVEIEFAGPVRIVIAENGTGKTTILSALQAFLRNDFSTLRKLQFESIECELGSGSETLVLNQNELAETKDLLNSEALTSLMEYTDIPLEILRQEILDLDDKYSYREKTSLRDVYARSPYDNEEFRRILNQIKAGQARPLSENLERIQVRMKALRDKYEILYLPTYRRIERPLLREDRDRFPAGVSKPRNYLRNKLMSGTDINFGLADVVERLQALFEDITRQSHIGYRAISAKIIDDLLAGPLRGSTSESMDLPEFDAVAKFFSRIDGQGSPMHRIESLRTLYDSGKINDQANATLRYFLSKLTTVVNRTRELESNIEAFVGKANVYLQQSSDEKQLQYNPTEMKVIVKNLWTDQEVKLDDLSSGEKQVISLLANLYLFPQTKIVLIDEPELSLSIDWQQRLLPDILDAPSCGQLLAITHSPFIFDNDLDPFAGPLRVLRKKLVKNDK